MIVPVPTGRRVYYVAPHSDDDLLMMGQISAHHALAARRVSFVLGSPGATTTAINALNGTVANGWWGGRHDPAREGYAPLTQADIVVSRDAEFRDSAALLGALPEEVHINDDLRHDLPTIGQARALLEHYHSLDPTAGFYTMHWDDIDPTHAMYGLALRQLRLEDPLAWADVRWVVRPEQATAPVGDPDRIPAAQYTVPGPYVNDAKLMVRQAARAYSAWAPRQGRFAVGYHSVGLSLFPGVVAGDPNWIVHP